MMRADDRGGVLGLSTSQAIGLVMIVLAAAIHVVRGRRIPAAVAPAAS
jgi:phosphatidylglycerol---prolipoprotein diacylglyceryl transferase